MTIYTKITIGGTTYQDSLNIDVERNIGDFNAASNFSVEFENFTGMYNNTFNLNDEVIIYADKDTNPATTKIFTGIIEDISFDGDASEERVTIRGRDYGAVLQDMTVSPIIYKNKDAGLIAKTIIANNAEGLVSVNNINLSTGVTIGAIGFNHKHIFNSLNELAELADCYWFVDEDKDVNFILKSTISSGETFDKTNVIRAKFKKEDREIFNKVWVYGDRVLTGNSQYLKSDGTGSVFTLTDKPHNTRVYTSGTNPAIIQPGGIINMDDPATKDSKWLLDFHNKQIVFTSGTTAGENIPAAGSVFMEYERLAPILKYIHDVTSITAYGPKTKIIKDSNIKSYVEANEKATAFLAENKDPKIQGTINIKGVITITAGNTCIVDLPWHGISSQTYTILSVSYSFNATNNLSEKVLTIDVNKKVSDFTDVMQDNMNRIRNVEIGELVGDFTTLKTATKHVDIDTHWEIWTGAINNNFVFHSEKHGLIESPDSRIGVGNLIQGGLGSTLVISGGGF